MMEQIDEIVWNKPVQKKKKSRRWLLWIILSASLVIILGTIFFFGDKEMMYSMMGLGNQNLEGFRYASGQQTLTIQDSCDTAELVIVQEDRDYPVEIKEDNIIIKSDTPVLSSKEVPIRIEVNRINTTIDSKTDEVVKTEYKEVAYSSAVILTSATAQKEIDIKNLLCQYGGELHIGENSTIIELAYTQNVADLFYRDIAYQQGILMKWNISNIPDGYTINDATLCLSNTYQNTLSQVSSVWYAQNQTWDETTTFGTPPDAMNMSGTFSVRLNNTNVTRSKMTSFVGELNCINITTQFWQSYANNDTFMTIIFENQDRLADWYDAEMQVCDETSCMGSALEIEAANIVYNDREKTTTGDRPILYITYTAPMIIKQRTPTNNSLVTSNNVNFVYNVTGNISAISSCNLTIDQRGVETLKSTASLNTVYHFNEDYYAESVNNISYLLTANGDAKFTKFKKLGTHAVYFDGAGDYLSAEGYIYNVFESFSFLAWINPNSTGNSFIISKDDSGDRGFGLEIYLNKLAYEVEGAWAINGSSSNYTIQPNQWQLVAVTYNSATGALRTYVNGSLDATASSIPQYYTASAQFRVGAREYTGAEGYFNGTIDEVAIYDKVLTDAEILDIYNNQSTSGEFGVVNSSSSIQTDTNQTLSYNLSDGDYTWQLKCYDGSVYYSETSIFNFSVNSSGADTIPPYFTYIPENATLNFSVSLGVDFNASDETEFDCFAVDDANNFTINCSGYLENKTALLNGTYILNITINDSSNNLNSTMWQVTAEEEICQNNITNTTATDWVNITCSDNMMNQSRNWTEYDINNCGNFSNVTWYDYQLVNDWQNTSKSSWENVGNCLANDTQLQNRSWIEYDVYTCGINVTWSETQEIACDYCNYNVTNTTWTDWVNLTCSGSMMNQSRNTTEYDSNWSTCYLVTTLPSDLWNSGNNNTYYEYQLVTERRNTSWSDWGNHTICYANDTRLQQRNNTEFDIYGCNSTNYTNYEYREVSCDGTPPVITVESPENISYSTSTVEFNASLNEDGLECRYNRNGETLLGGSLLWRNMSKFNVTYFNYTKTGLAEGSHYVWFNCTDLAGNYGVSSKLYFYISIDTGTSSLDITPPTITLLSPVNSSTIYAGSTTLSYVVSDESVVSSCGLIINGTVNKTDNTISKDIEQTFTYTFVVSNTTWGVTCTDAELNTGYSDTFDLQIISVPAGTTSCTVNTLSKLATGETPFVRLCRGNMFI